MNAIVFIFVAKIPVFVFKAYFSVTSPFARIFRPTEVFVLFLILSLMCINISINYYLLRMCYYNYFTLFCSIVHCSFMMSFWQCKNGVSSIGQKHLNMRLKMIRMIGCICCELIVCNISSKMISVCYNLWYDYRAPTAKS